ncbi:hypothetical protein BaRGS_00034585 [Batillaria attramentaria]|uniref:Uncharacterized protein n=1 Tax=Batillaria attramentaria TaxID=370345 RepID=A0ABD0JH13_9CAEN
MGIDTREITLPEGRKSALGGIIRGSLCAWSQVLSFSMARHFFVDAKSEGVENPVTGGIADPLRRTDVFMSFCGAIVSDFYEF